MAYPPRLQLDKGFYHVIQRGNARQAIFDGGRDNEAFLERLRKAARVFEIRLKLNHPDVWAALGGGSADQPKPAEKKPAKP